MSEGMDLLDEKKMSIIRRYPLETLVTFILALCLFLVSWQYKTSTKVDALQNEMKSYLHEDRKALIEALNKNTDVMSDVKDFLKHKNYNNESN